MEHNLANRIVMLEEQLKQYNTSQPIGQGSNQRRLVGSFSIFDNTVTSLSLDIVFLSDGLIYPLLMVEADMYINGVKKSASLNFDRRSALDHVATKSQFSNLFLSPNNPLANGLTMQASVTQLFPSSEWNAKNFEIRGNIYANTTGVCHWVYGSDNHLGDNEIVDGA